MSLVQPDDFNDYGGSGTHSAADLQMAIDLAEFDVENVLTTAVTPTTVTEEYLWPLHDGKIMLNHSFVNSLTTVQAKHSINIDCVWVTDIECGVILNRDDGRILVIGCNFHLGQCACTNDIVPDRLVITYVYGFTAEETAASTALGKALRMAIILRARQLLPLLEQGDDWEGSYFVKSWNSMDYGERREYLEMASNPLGAGPFNQEAFRILSQIKGKAAVMLRSSGRY